MKIKSIRYLLLFCYISIANGVFGQANSKVIDPKELKDLFKKSNYHAALKGYLALIEKEPKNEEYNYYAGICYLNTNIDKKKAISYLETANNNDNCDPNTLFYLGRAYHLAYRFDDAIDAFTKFKESGKGDKENQAAADQQIQYCINAKELIKFPIKVSFENLGETVNSPYPDYMPFLPEDESFIIYPRPAGHAHRHRRDRG